MRFATKFVMAIVAWNFLPPAEEADAAVVPAGKTFTCTPVAVWDGDGPVWCAEGPKIRIAGVAAREIGGTCRRHQPCPSVSGADARNRLVRLLGGAKGTLKDGHIKVHTASMSCVLLARPEARVRRLGVGPRYSAISPAPWCGPAERYAGRASGGITAARRVEQRRSFATPSTKAPEGSWKPGRRRNDL